MTARGASTLALAAALFTGCASAGSAAGAGKGANSGAASASTAASASSSTSASAASSAASNTSAAPKTLPSLQPEPGWPRWLEDSNSRTHQTSGLAYVGRNSSGARVFLAADDEGDLWRLELAPPDDEFLLEQIEFVGAARETLARFPKDDFEDITYCPISHRVLVSIEGNGPKEDEADTTFRDWLGIFELQIEPDVMHAERVPKVDRLPLPEWRDATRYACRNVGFEAAAACMDTIVLGLEGVMLGPGLFADSTFIQVFDLARGTRLEFSTSGHAIGTATGLARASSGAYYGIDRNSARLFTFTIRDGALRDVRTIGLSMPGIHGVPYLIPSAESIAIDDEDYLWIVVDPWKYEPMTQEGLSPRDIDNFRDKVPLIYKYRDPFTTADAGTSGGKPDDGGAKKNARDGGGKPNGGSEGERPKGESR